MPCVKDEGETLEDEKQPQRKTNDIKATDLNIPVPLHKRNDYRGNSTRNKPHDRCRYCKSFPDTLNLALNDTQTVVYC